VEDQTIPPGDEDGIYELTKTVCEEEGTPHFTADKDRWMRRWRWEHLENSEGSLIVVADLRYVEVMALLDFRGCREVSTGECT